MTVKDRALNAVPDINVMFLSNIGNIIPSATTNEYGIATSTLKSENVTGVAYIQAIIRIYDEEYPNLLVCSDTACIQVVIAVNPPISSVDLEFPSSENPYPMNPEQSITVRARARNIIGYYVPDNTLIKFNTTIGLFMDAEGNPMGIEAEIRTVNGWATIVFNSGIECRTGLVQARIANRTAIRNVIVTP